MINNYFDDKLIEIIIVNNEIVDNNFLDSINYKLDWEFICSELKLTNKFMIDNKKELFWSSISYSQKLNLEFIKRFKDDIDWYIISIHQKLNEKTISEFKDLVDWYMITLYQDLTEDFMEKYSDKLDWYWLSQEQFMTLEFIARNIDLLDWEMLPTNSRISFLLNDGFVFLFQNKPIWNNIGHMEKVTQECLEQYYDKIPENAWIDIFENKKLSIDFIKKYLNNNNCVSNDIWSSISENVDLSIEFIDEFKDNLDWDILSTNYNFSKDNIIKYKKYLQLDSLSKNDIINDEYLDLILNNLDEFNGDIDWEYVSEYSNISLKFAEKCKFTIKPLYLENINIKSQLAKKEINK